MKKIITLSLISLFVLFASYSSQAQSDYASKKMQFWQMYQDYKNNIVKVKPTDPSGLFFIDENGNFAVKNSAILNNKNNFNAPWINGTPDVVSNYTWSQDTTVYSPVYGGTILCAASFCDDGNHPNIPIGFTFNYNGTDYTTVSIQQNGWLMMGNGSPFGYSPICAGSYPNVIAGFARDLLGTVAGGDTLRYLMTGSAPNRIFTVEWMHWGFYSSGLNEIDFQIQLYETTNQVKLVYKPQTPTTTITDLQVGLMGLTNADYSTRTTTSNWSATTAGTACSYNTFSSTVYPTNGLRFTWTPCTAPYAYASSTTTQSNTSPVYAPSSNTQIAGVEIVITGCVPPTLDATSFTFNTAGSTNPGTDITRAKLWYTGTSSTFATTNQFGSLFNNPNGSFSITGTQTLAFGTNYFWLTYDVPSGAGVGDTLDAQCNSLIVGGISRTPTVQSPAGNRIIAGTALSGNYTIPGSFPNFTSAIGALNTRGIMGPVTFSVAPNFVDTAANLIITTSGTASMPIVFRGTSSQPLAYPKIIAGTGVGSMDGIIILNGADYITFDGINLEENPANTTTTTQMEWGYALLKPDATNGCQNVTIQNCSITLNKTNTATSGIYSNNHSPTSITTFTITTAAGTNSNNAFLNNTITNCYSPLWLAGYFNNAPPYAFMDLNNTVSGNSLTNWGGSSSFAYGMYCYSQRQTVVTNNTINSAGGTNNTTTMYGMYFSSNYNSDLTVSNNTVNLVCAATGSTIYGIYMSIGSGTTNTVNVLNNAVTIDYSTATFGGMYAIYSSNPSKDLTISGNRIVGCVYGSATSTGTSIYGIYNPSSTVNSITITNNLDSGNVVRGTSSYSTYRIYSAGGTNNCTITGNQIKNDTLCGTTAGGTTYGIYNSAGTYTCNMSNNTVANNVLPTSGFQSMYHLYNFSPAPAQDYNNNTVTGTVNTGIGSLYGMYYSGAPQLGATVNINNNSVTNLSKTVSGSGSIYGIYQVGSTSGTLNLNSNTVTGLTSTGAATLYGIYQGSSPPYSVNINNNSVGNLTNGGISTIYGVYTTGSTANTANYTVTGDSVFNMTSAGGTIYGMYITGGFKWNVYKNKISGITSSTNTSASVYGLYSSVITAGAISNIYNNNISDINATASTNYLSPAVSGININNGSAAASLNVFYNTILLKAISSSTTTFGVAGIFASTTPVVNLRNNVVIDSSTPGPTGGSVVAYWRSSNTLTTYSNASNNNCFYSGTPAANKLIFYDGTNSIQTLAAYKTFVLPRDNNSFTEMPPFVNGAAPPYDLRIRTNVGTQLESGAQIISSPISITDDIYGTPRYPNPGYPIGGYTPTAPDAGANEFGGLNADLIPPQITYTPLGNGGTTNRPFTNVIITDQSGVNTALGTRPRCYYKRSTDSNVVNDTTNLTDGWKWVQANGTTSPFDFTIDYSKLVGGTGVTPGTVIQYFVIAQDLATTPNVGAVQATFPAAPVSVALTSANMPVSNTLSYTIVTNSFSGSYNVGTTETYTSLTGAGGLFAAINGGTVSGNITAVITSDLTEDGTNPLYAFNETGVGGYRLRIIPSSASVKTISGNVAQGMIRFDGVDRVTVDGGSFFAGNSQMNIGTPLPGNSPVPGKFLTFRNNNGANPTFVFINDAIGDSIKYCNIESNNATAYTSPTNCGTILFSTTTGTQGNDSNVIAYCDIRDLSNATGYPANCIFSNGTTTSLTQYNNYNTITNCNIYNFFLEPSSAGIFLNTGSSDWAITNNSIYQQVTRTITNSGNGSHIGIFNSSSLDNNILVSGNYIGGSAPLCGGTPLTYTTSGSGLYSFNAIYLYVGGLVPSSIQGNTIQNYNLTCNSTSTSEFFRGIKCTNSTGIVNVGNITGNTIGNATSTGNITLTTNTSTATYFLYAIEHTGWGNISNNTIGSITLGGTSTLVNFRCISWSPVFAGPTVMTISNNICGSNTVANSIYQPPDAVRGTSSRGISAISVNSPQTVNITNNIVANWNFGNSSSTVSSTVNGIQATGTGVHNFTGNVIHDMSLATGYAGFTNMLCGIQPGGTGILNFSQNTIYSLDLTNTGAFSSFIEGALITGGIPGSVITRNKVYDLTSQQTGTSPTIVGLGFFNAVSVTADVSNNMISLTNGEPIDKMQGTPEVSPYKETDVQLVADRDFLNAQKIEKRATEIKMEKYPEHQGDIVNDLNLRNFNPKNKTGDNADYTIGMVIQGFEVYNSGFLNLYYNTVYVGGSAVSGSNNSAAFFRFFGTGAMYLRDNLFINARTGGAGKHYVVSNQVGAPGWTSTASNYNTFIGSNDTTIGEWGAGVDRTIDQWRTSSGGDNQSWSTNTSTINPANMLVSIGTGNLNIVTGNSAAWIVSGKGIAVSSVNNDYNGSPRVTAISGGCTDIGAHEFTQTPPSNPAATQLGTPGSGTTTTYRLYGRTICQIDWGTGGSSYPTLMNVNYYSGVTPSPNITSPNRSSNSYWAVTIGGGSLLGAKYDATFFFGDNETFTITSPNTNTLLAKYKTSSPTFWQTYPGGLGIQQSNLDWLNLTLEVSGINNSFSNFALSDAALPSCNLVSPAYDTTVSTASPTLVWMRSAGSTSHRVRVATDSNFTNIIKDTTTSDTTKLLTGLVNGSTYWWQVQGTNGIGTGAFSQLFKFKVVTTLPPAIVNLSVIPGGFYNTGSGRLNMRDTIRVYLVDSATCTRVDSTIGVLDSVTFSISPAASFAIANTGNYYIFVRHRNHLMIASRLTQNIVRGSTVAYDFTTDSAKTYGYNMIKVSASPVRWGMIPGDANQDGFVDGLDQTIWILQNGLDGYLSADFNGDLFVDGLDQTIWILQNGTASYLPCYFDVWNPGEKEKAYLREMQKKFEQNGMILPKDNNTIYRKNRN